MNEIKGGHLVLLNVALGLGTFIQILDSSIANVAVPYIAGNLSVSADNGTWVITSFAASYGIVLPLTGWLSDYFGRVRLYVWSVLLFTLTSFLCGLSTSLTMLVFLRVLQGAVAGSLIPLSQSLMVTSNPPEKVGAALGFWAMIVVVAPVVGPILGGYLTDVYSWPWIFYINVPIGLFSAGLTWYYLRNRESEIVRNPIDWVGLILLSLGVACMQIMLDKGKDLDWFESNFIICLTLISAISMLYFVIWNLSQKYPVVDFTFFKNLNFVFGCLAITVGFLFYFGSTVTVPLWLQTEQDYTAYWAGIAVAPIGLIPVFLSTTVGKNMQRFDLRLLASLSFVFFAIGFFYQSRFTTQVDLRTIMLARFLQGFGIVFFFLPIVQLSLGEIPGERYASASGLFHFIRILVGSGFGTSLSIELWSHREIFHHARLSDSIVAANPIVSNFYEGFEAQLSPPVISSLVDRGVQQQAYMLSTNELSWLGGICFLCLIPIIYLCKPIKAPAAKPQAVH
ncbi:MAG: DHA2 family efflux MFS transporter permease subunit [Parachlamydia sp.]|nr:DHA2 family efflux MFS transporter permease subunit [Parachlamydia sp.]